jgi:GntP family gluconate:H+ symporter
VQRLAEWSGVTNVLGNANFALLVSTVIAIGTVVKQRRLSRRETAAVLETSLMSGGVIILITAGGGAFGAMLKTAQVGEAIRQSFSQFGAGTGIAVLVLGFGIAAVLKIAQGSSTVAMITGSAMLAGIAQPAALGFHPVYLACAIGAGSLVGSWMNDSGFWIFAKMSGLTEVEALKAWTPMLIVLAVVALAATVSLASVLPLAGA